MLYQIPQNLVNPDGTVTVVKAHFGGSAFPLSKLGFDTHVTIYVGFLALLVNLVVASSPPLVLRAMKVPDGEDRTKADEYFADEGDTRLHDIPELVH